jgi:hypothetical protein
MAIEVLSLHRPWGRVSCLAEEFDISRKTAYDIAAAGERVLMTFFGQDRGQPPISREKG